MPEVVFDLIGVCNESLGLLGKAPITSLDDPDTVSRLCKQYLPSLLHTILRDHDWNFNSEHAELAQEVATPMLEFAYQYTLPADCVRVYTLNESDQIDWKIKGRKLLTDEGTAKIKYGRYIDDPNEWDGMFRQAMVTLLAYRLCGPLTGNDKKATEFLKQFQAQLSDAKAVDGQEGSQDVLESTALTDDIRET